METIETLLELMSLHGGKIVCTAQLDVEQINQARASGRMYVDKNSIGFVWEPEILKMPTNDEEVMFFEKWYPLPVEVPEDINTWEKLQVRMKRPKPTDN